MSFAADSWELLTYEWVKFSNHLIGLKLASRFRVLTSGAGALNWDKTLVTWLIGGRDSGFWNQIIWVCETTSKSQSVYLLIFKVNQDSLGDDLPYLSV